MISVEQAREKLPDQYKSLPDEEIEKILSFFYSLAYSIVDDLIQKSNN